jgi:thiosulfate reductase cytochrome b subunit
VAACVLSGFLLWHLIRLAVSGSMRRRLRGLMWALQDMRDFMLLQRFNLGLVPHRPRFGKFSYIEKAEYWAFIWGTVLMAVMGILLWFENFTLRYLRNGLPT